MSSFVRRLAKSFSMDETSRRENTRPDSLLTARSLPRQLHASPSFNDFSLHAGDDVDTDCMASWASSGTPTSAGSAASYERSEKVSATPKVPSKIIGMDPYDFCDLLRPSSF